VFLTVEAATTVGRGLTQTVFFNNLMSNERKHIDVDFEQQSVNLLQSIVPLTADVNLQADAQIAEVDRQGKIIKQVQGYNDKMDTHIEQSESLIAKMTRRLKCISCFR
jgi:hypothetical protein